MRPTVHHYTAYGLRIRSELAVHLSPAAPEGEPDVSIRIGEVPEAPAAPESGRQRPWEAAPGVFLLKVDGVARYLVTEGRDIVVEPAGGGNQAMSAFLLGTVLAACLQQRGILTLHASAIETRAGAVLFASRSGAGKSTLLAALVERGYAMLSDDVAGIVLDAGGRPVALPAFPYVRLWADAVDELGWPARERVREGIEKYLVQVERFRNTPLAVRAVFALTPRNRDGIEIETKPPAAAFRLLVNRTFRERHLRGLGRQREHFRVVAAIANQVPVHHVNRPAHPFPLDALTDGLDALTDGIEDCLREAPPADTDGQPAAMAGRAARADGAATSR